MNISYKWLKDFVEIDMSPLELAEKLTLIGLELDGLHDVRDDSVLDIETTSNRGDCLSHLGVAREVAVATQKTLNVPEPGIPHADAGAGLVAIEAPEICHRFTARIIRNVKIGPSPEWLVKRLEAVGERSINNIADITNYAMHALGQPMHAFDLDKLEEGRIVVRRAAKGEKITTLDEVERECDDSMLVICDASKPAAVGGVMGGFESGITEETSNVLIEVACFEPLNIRSTSRTLGLATEASYRFERGVDIENLIRASDFASALIVELAEGELGEFADVYPSKPEVLSIDAPELKEEIERLSGLRVERNEIERILSDLGLTKTSQDVYSPPSWRHDLFIEEDLVEEVVRIAGYDRIGEELPPGGGSGQYQPSEGRKRDLRKSLATVGFDEAISYSFIDERHDGLFEYLPGLRSAAAEEYVEIRDPIIDGATMMRPTLIPGLLESIRTNFNQRLRDVKLYELGKVFAAGDSEDGLPFERELLAMALTGSETFEENEAPGRKLDFFDLKGALELVFDAARLDPPELRPCKTMHLQTGQSAEVVHSGVVVGYIGKLDNELSEGYKFRQPVFIAEIDLDALLAEPESPPTYTSLPVFPSVARDVSMAVKRGTTFGSIREAIESQGFELCRAVSFVDVFEGKGLADDERAITVRLEYRSDERTLTEEEVDRVHAEILKNLRSAVDFDTR